MISTPRLLIKLRKALGNVDDQDLPEEDALELLNQSFYELLSKFPFREKEATTNWPTVAGIRTYDIPTNFEALTLLAIVDPVTLKHSPIDKWTDRKYEIEYSGNESLRSVPEAYYRENQKIVLHPTPDAIYTMVMKWLVSLSPLAPDVDASIPQEWHELILYGAIYRGFLEFGDTNRANTFSNMQAKILNTMVPVESKEEVDYHEASVEIIRRGRDW